MSRPSLHVPAERLSPRARFYLGVALAQHAVIGTAALCEPTYFAGPSFDGIKSALPGIPPGQAMYVWGVLLLAVTALCGWAALAGSEGLARAALLASVLVEGVWLGGYVASAVAAGGLFSIVGIAVWSALIGRDLTMLRQPLRNPFEPILRRVLDEHEHRDEVPPRPAAA